MKRETFHVVVDDSVIARSDVWLVIDPVWWLANIYDGPVAYSKSLERFSRPQRLVFAIIWYVKEICNGGHKQFYMNSTGVVWKDAQEGLEDIGIARAANILRISAERFEGEPSLDRMERREQLEVVQPDFRDLDDAFFDCRKKTDFDAAILTYIRSQPAEFYFSGNVEKVVLPTLSSSPRPNKI